MAKKKAAPSRSAEPSARTFAVVLEDLRAQFGVFGEALQGLRERMEARFEAMEARFEAVDARFEAVDARFEAVDARFDRTDSELSFVKTAVLENSRVLKAHARALAEQSTSGD